MRLRSTKVIIDTYLTSQLDILFAQVSTFLKDSTTFVYGLGAFNREFLLKYLD